jgi:hypothetical protein
MHASESESATIVESDLRVRVLGRKTQAGTGLKKLRTRLVLATSTGDPTFIRVGLDR